MQKENSDLLLRIAFVVSLVATLGSLFFSEVMKLPPCVLCWYQRIAMYPLVVIFFVGLARTGKECAHYAIPLIGIGWMISFYHNLLYYGLIENSIVPCSQGVSCTSRQIEWLGFITIPFLSWLGFTALLLLTFFAYFGSVQNFITQLKTGKL